MSVHDPARPAPRDDAQRLRELFDGVDAIIASLDAGRVRYNRRLYDVLGYDPDALPGQFDWERLTHPDDRAACDAVWRSDATHWEMEYRMRRADGAYVWVRDRGRREKDPDGSLSALFCVITDISALREATEAREALLAQTQAQETLFRELIERQDAITWVSETSDGGNLYMSPQVETILGYPAERWREPGFWQTTLHPDDAARVIGATASPGGVVETEYRSIAADGRVVWFRERVRSFRGPDGRELRYGIALDITRLRAAEADFQESERRLREVIAGVDAAIGYGGDPPGTVVISAQIEGILGYPPSAITTYTDWHALVHPDDLEACEAVWTSRRTHWSMTYRLRHADGHWVWVRDRARRTLDPDGRPDRIYFVVTDATATRAAEEERRSLERRTAELAKLEALARVAASTAHDFGNVLVGIDVFAKYLAANPLLDERARRDVAQIRQAVATGRAATAGLVALGNLRETELVAADLHALVEALTPSLLGLLGPEIVLQVRLDAPDAAIEIEPAALERAVINLAVNARDAMPRGGVLTIATSEVEEDETTPTAAGIALPGRYLSLAVSDDGNGMSPETLAKAFEPYFTTKPVGKGTGLGLSSVHAVANAVDGHVHAESAPGLGTTFRICLPLL